MKRNALLVGLVAVMLLLSGCNGILGDDGVSPTENGSDGEVNTLDADVQETHAQALQDAESFNSTYTLSVVPENPNSTRISEMDVQSDYRVDMGAERYFSTEDSTQATVQTYTMNDTTYQQVHVDGAANASYRTASAPYADNPQELQPFNVDTAAGNNLLLVENITYEQSHKAPYGEEGNTSVTVYEAGGTDATETMQAQIDATAAEDSNVEIVSFAATAKVDEDGILRQQTIEYTVNESGITYTTTVTHDISTVGNVTISNPDWLDTAMNQTASNNSTDARP